jgi:two-component system chemotaxis response regulator CheB
VPVVVVSAFSPAAGARAVDALAEGAFELVPKPTGSDDVDTFEQALLSKIRAAGRRFALPGARRRPPAPPAAVNGHGPRTPRPVSTRRGVSQVVLIATSTGGPRALAELIPQLPSPLGLGTMIVQHMPAGFTASLASRLDRASRLSVREAEGGEPLSPSVALLAPGGHHLRLGPDGATVLSDEAPMGGLRPRADLLIEDAAKRFGERLLLVVLTGMGNDGLRGARAVKAHGGRVIAEAEESCTVYGMPRAVAEADLVDQVAPLHEMASLIESEVR